MTPSHLEGVGGWSHLELDSPVCKMRRMRRICRSRWESKSLKVFLASGELHPSPRALLLHPAQPAADSAPGSLTMCVDPTFFYPTTPVSALLSSYSLSPFPSFSLPCLQITVGAWEFLGASALLKHRVRIVKITLQIKSSQVVFISGI